MINVDDPQLDVDQVVSRLPADLLELSPEQLDGFTITYCHKHNRMIQIQTSLHSCRKGVDVSGPAASLAIRRSPGSTMKACECSVQSSQGRSLIWSSWDRYLLCCPTTPAQSPTDQQHSARDHPWLFITGASVYVEKLFKSYME